MVKLRCPYLHSFGRTPAPPPSRSAPRGLSGIGCRPVQRVQRPGRVCRCAAPCMVCPATCVCRRSGCAGVGRGAPAGHIAATQPRPVSPVTTEKIKKAQKNHPTLIVNLKNFPQKQKDPYKGSVFCAILALQALKGRNTQ